jgi:hypothetical protein
MAEKAEKKQKASNLAAFLPFFRLSRGGEWPKRQGWG